MAERPLPRRGSPPDGYVYEAQALPDWRLAQGRRCRGGRPACGRPAVAEVNRRRSTLRRGYVDSWWAYCEAHLGEYGDWIEDGQVMGWHLVEVQAP